MPGSSFGTLFRITTAGESHGPGNLVIVDGCPPGLEIGVEEIQLELDRRKPGQSRIVTPRKEPDAPEILSGVFEGRTTGSPIAILIRNVDQRSRDYKDIASTYRPGHADQAYDAKYGFRDYRGGGRASARETSARVAAGAIAKKLLTQVFGAHVVGYVDRVGDVHADIEDPAQVTLDQVETRPDGQPNIVRCPDIAAADKMITAIDEARRARDSLGGIAVVCATNLPAGLGEPVFDKLKADLGKSLLSLPAVVGVEYGAGFAAASLKGSEHNDAFLQTEDGVRTATNRHGGILGGISSGMPIVVRAAVKPTSSLPQKQSTVTREGEATTVQTKGRHDPCVLPRFVPMAEAMVALVLVDHWLRWSAQRRGLEPM